MMKKSLYLSIFLLFISVLTIAQPKVFQNEVTLYLSNGEIKTGLLIEIKIEVSPTNRTLVIWNNAEGYITYPVQDIEALTHNYSRDQVAKDMSSIKWRGEKDVIALVEPSSGIRVELLKNVFTQYDNVHGLYKFKNIQYKWKEIGAVYFFNSNHAHFITTENEFAQAPTLTQNVQPTPTPRRDDGRRREKIINPRPQRRPDLVVNLPASQPMFKGSSVNTGERFYFEVEGLIKINPSVEVNAIGYGGDAQSRYLPAAATGVPLVFISPEGDLHVKIPPPGELAVITNSLTYAAPKYGLMCFTINDSNFKDNSGSFTIKVWRLD